MLFMCGMLCMAVICGFWVIGSGLLHAAEMKKRREPPSEEA